MQVSQTHTERCKSLVSAIDNLSKTEIEEMFKMIHKRHKDYTRNNNGVFINLTWVNEDLLNDLENYVRFCTCSRTELRKFESLCDVLNSNMKTLDTKQLCEIVKDTIELNQETNEVVEDVVDTETEIETEKIINKVSSSARFAMLKKRFSKQTNEYLHEYENDLKLEQYIYT